MAVHGVDTVEQWNPQAGGERLALVAVVHVAPVVESVLGRRVGAAAVEDRAEKVGRDVLFGFEEFHVGLGHLADLLLQRHPGQQLVDPRIERGERGALWRLRVCSGCGSGLLSGRAGAGEEERHGKRGSLDHASSFS